MGSLVDYDKHYRKGRGHCGEPFVEFVAFFDGYEKTRARVLDLGCGQGRDALMIAARGHEVVGVDLSKVGVAQMLQDAKRRRVRVEGVVADVLDYRSRRKFDVVLLDRVLHLLRADEERERCLQLATRLAKKGGYVLVADTPKHAAQIRAFFDARVDAWTLFKRTKNFTFARRD